MKKKIEKKRNLEKKLLLKSQTLRHLDLKATTGSGGTGSEAGCTDNASCGIQTCGCTGTFQGTS